MAPHQPVFARSVWGEASLSGRDGSNIMERAQAEQILQQALSYQQADHLQLSLHGEVGAYTRFANNTITQNTAQKDTA